MRNTNPFTERQIRLLEAIREKIREINDPEPEIITHEFYDWHIEATKEFGQIPKIRFRPNSGQIKAELLEQAGLLDKSREEELAQIRQRYGVGEARNREARLFESEWNNIMLKVKKAMFTIALMNQLFSNQNQTISEPTKLMQSIVMYEYAPLIKIKREAMHGRESEGNQQNSKIKGYDEELEAVE